MTVKEIYDNMSQPIIIINICRRIILKMKLGKLSKKILITSVILSSIALVGCTTNNSTNKENNSSDNQITVQHKLGTTKLNSKPKKIAVLELSFLDSLHNLDIDPVAIADDGESNKVTDVTNGEKIDYVSVGDRKEPNLEELSSMDLDLIIADTSRHSEIYEDLNKIAPTTIVSKTNPIKKPNRETPGTIVN